MRIRLDIEDLDGIALVKQRSYLPIRGQSWPGDETARSLIDQDQTNPIKIRQALCEWTFVFLETKNKRAFKNSFVLHLLVGRKTKPERGRIDPNERAGANFHMFSKTTCQIKDREQIFYTDVVPQSMNRR